MIKKLSSLFLLLNAVVLFSQNNYSSIYSRYGIGEIFPKGYANNFAMGYSGIAYRDANYLNDINAASYTEFDTMTVIFNFGLNGKYTSVNTTNASENHYYANISNISLGFPITKWYFAGIGAKPYSQTNYSISNTSELIDNLGNTITEYTQSNTGLGSINQLYITQAFKLTKNLSLAGHISYLYGSIINTTSLKFPTDFGAQNMFEQNKTFVNDFYFDFATQYYTKLSKNIKLTVGLIYDIKKNIASQTTTSVQSYQGSNTSSIDTLENATTNKNNLTLPMSIGGGIGLKYKQSYNFLLDFTYTDWKNAKFFEQTDVKNSSNISFGLEITPNTNSLTYLNRVKYRIGGYYKNSYIIVKENQLNDFGITFGIGAPIRKTGTSFNFAFVFGQLQPTSKDLINEKYVGVSLSLSFMDKWFYQRKFD
jgi:hypothetical protein